MLVSISNPGIVRDWDHKFDDMDFNKDLYAKALRRKYVELSIPAFAEDLRLIKVGQKYLGIDDKRGYVFYYNSVSVRNRYSAKLGRHATQVELWNSRDPAYDVGLAKYMFQYLLAEHSTVVSDSLQTADGRRFWSKRAGEVFSGFNPGFNVYVWFIDSNELIRARGVSHYIQLCDRAYGTLPKHERALIVISKHDLEGQSK